MERNGASPQGAGSQRFRGSAISPGLAAGESFVYWDTLSSSASGYRVAPSQVSAEHARLKQARDSVLKDLEGAYRRVKAQMDPSLADVFRAQQQMLDNPALWKEVAEELGAALLTAEEAARRVFCHWAERFRMSASMTTAGRAEDIADLARRLLRAMEGIDVHPLEEMPIGSILVAQRLAPSDAVHFHRRAAAVVVESGTPGAHCALMARQAGIPVVGNIPDVVKKVPSGSSVLVDGFEGTVIVHPDDDLRAQFERRKTRYAAEGAAAKRRASEPAVTADGVVTEVAANISSRADAELAVENGADGVGLYRTEALFMYRKSLPAEEELIKELSHTLDPLGLKSCIVRLLDIGGDKHLPYLRLPSESSPFLGRRGIRLLFAYPELLKVQLRALLRLSETRNIQIMIPMVTVAEDARRIRQVRDSLAQELGVTALPPLVAMIETPAAALSVRDILESVDSLSIGTNDLTQYTMAAGRQNPLVNNYFQEDHPAMIRLVRMVCQDAGSVQVGMCGELAGRLHIIPTLLRSGIRRFSVAPRLIPLVKETIRRTEMSKAIA